MEPLQGAPGSVLRPSLCSNPLGELVACRLTSTMADFQDRFQELLMCAGPLQENQKTQLFLAGLGEPLSLDVQIQGPSRSPWP